MYACFDKGMKIDVESILFACKWLNRCCVCDNFQWFISCFRAI